MFPLCERFRQLALSETLRRLAVHGARDFYIGATGRRIVEDMEKNSGLITRDDLAKAAIPLGREPVLMEYRGPPRPQRGVSKAEAEKAESAMTLQSDEPSCRSGECAAGRAPAPETRTHLEPHRWHGEEVH